MAALPTGVFSSCVDSDADCASWASAGECGSNPEFMLSVCRLSCGACVPPQEDPTAGTVPDGEATPGAHSPVGHNSPADEGPIATNVPEDVPGALPEATPDASTMPIPVLAPKTSRLEHIQHVVRAAYLYAKGPAKPVVMAVSAVLLSIMWVAVQHMLRARALRTRHSAAGTAGAAEAASHESGDLRARRMAHYHDSSAEYPSVRPTRARAAAPTVKSPSSSADIPASSVRGAASAQDTATSRLVLSSKQPAADALTPSPVPPDSSRASHPPAAITTRAGTTPHAASHTPRLITTQSAAQQNAPRSPPLPACIPAPEPQWARQRPCCAQAKRTP